MERVKTSIPGFDDLIDGGIPKGFNVLLTGLPGTGKTIFGLQYVYNAAISGQNAVYVSFESSPTLLREQAKQFGWDFAELEKKGNVILLQIPIDKPKINIFDILEDTIEKTKATVLVFDSLATFAINIDQFVIPLEYVQEWPSGTSKPTSSNLNIQDNKYRYEVMPVIGEDPKGRVFYKGTDEKRITYLVINELSKLGTTNLLITDEKQGGDQLTVDGISEFVCDGVVRLHAVEGEDQFNTLNIVKMRLTEIKRGIYNFIIGRTGITISTN